MYAALRLGGVRYEERCIARGVKAEAAILGPCRRAACLVLNIAYFEINKFG